MYSIGGTTMFVGEIVNVRDLGGGKGYITFKFITNDTPTDGPTLVSTTPYCVLYWEGYTDDPKSVCMSAASSSSNPGDTGKATKEDAEAEYTKENEAGYFSDIGGVGKLTPPSY
jgi:hypothetical protein